MNTRVLIIDDSVFMRSILKSALTGAEGIEVIATAQNGADGLKKIVELKPDVVTLDIEMPGLDGLQVLARVMEECPLPVVMVSTKTQQGAEATLEALRLGAVDYVPKPVGDRAATLGGFRDKVVHAVRTAAQSNRRTLGRVRTPILPASFSGDVPKGVVVAIGISAGGPATLHEMIPAIPAESPPIVITQHMPADFTGSFARRLNHVAKIEVKEAQDGDELVPGRALLAPGSHHLRVIKTTGRLVASLDNGPKVCGFRPSADVMFESVASAVGPLAVAVVMTGMGCDGSAGVRIIKKHGGATIAQDEATSVVYGMPKAAFETGCIDRVEPVGRIPRAIAEAVRQVSVACG
jgi:two-component system chemotaxis response regulator CheB